MATIKTRRVTKKEQREHLDLLGNWDRLHRDRHNGDTELEGQIKAMETAFHMQKRAMQTFDISREPESVRQMYGETTFGRSCLLARRLVEEGGRFVTVYYTSGNEHQTPDTHPG